MSYAFHKRLHFFTKNPNRFTLSFSHNGFNSSFDPTRLTTQAEPARIHGITAWAEDIHVIAVRFQDNLLRKRFTISHELGHILLKIHEKNDQKAREKLCHIFAGAFLLPKSVINAELGEHRTKIAWKTHVPPDVVDEVQEDNSDGLGDRLVAIRKAIKRLVVIQVNFR